MATPAANLNVPPTTTITEEISAIFNRILLEAEFYGNRGVDELRDYVLTSLYALRFWIFANVTSILIYRTVADLNADPVSGALVYTPEVNFFWYLALFTTFGSIISYFWVYGRLSLLAGLVGMVEKLFIAGGRLLSFVVPDPIERLWINKQALEEALNNLEEGKALQNTAAKVIGVYLEIVTWVSAVGYVLLRWPLKIGFVGTILSLIGIGTAVFISIRWSEKPYWLRKIKNALYYFVGIGTTYDLLIGPILRWMFGSDLDTALLWISDHRALLGVIALVIIAALLLGRKFGWKEKDVFVIPGPVWAVLAVVVLLVLIYNINPIYHYLLSNTPGRLQAIEDYRKTHSDNPNTMGYNQYTQKVVKEAMAKPATTPVETKQPELSAAVKASLVNKAVYTNPRTSEIFWYADGVFHPVSNNRAFDYIRLMPPNVPASMIGDPVEVN